MKRIIVLVAALLAPLSLGAQDTAKVEKPDSAITAEFGFYHQSFGTKDGITPRFFGQGYEYFRTRVSCGHWGFGYGEEGYLSATWGVFCDPAPWLSLGLAVGGESTAGEEKTSIFGRWATTAFIGTEKTFLEVYFENGPSKTPWQRTDLQLWANKWLAVGGISQTGDGFGPKLRLNIPVRARWDFRIWGAPMFKSGERNLLLGGEFVWTLRESQ